MALFSVSVTDYPVSIRQMVDWAGYSACSPAASGTRFRSLALPAVITAPAAALYRCNLGPKLPPLAHT